MTIEKPGWLLYGEKVRHDLATMKDTKSGKRSEQRVWQTYRVARQEKGYEGTLADWHHRRNQPVGLTGL